MRKYLLSIANLISVTVLALCLSSCAAQPVNSSVQSSTLAKDGWFPGEWIHPPKDNNLTPQLSLPASRQGVTPEGFFYTIYSDGSGGIGRTQNNALNGWSVDCSKDAMTDRRECKLSSYASGIFIIYSASAAPKWICISGHDFPGRKGAIRIDNDSPITTDFDGCIAGTHLARLASANTVTLRSYKWPYDYPGDATKPLDGIKQAIALTTHIYKNIDHLSFSTSP